MYILFVEIGKCGDVHCIAHDNGDKIDTNGINTSEARYSNLHEGPRDQLLTSRSSSSRASSTVSTVARRVFSLFYYFLPLQLFGSKAFKALLEKLLGGASVVASRRQARRFRPGLDYTLATPGAPWAWKGGRHGRNAAAGDDNKGNNEDDGDEEEEENYMVMDAVLCFVDDREPYKEAAWRQDEVGGYVTYLGGDDGEGVSPQLGNGASAAGQEGSLAEAKGNGSFGTGDGGKNDAAVYQADEGGSLVSVSAASNALSLVLRDDTSITSFVKYVSSAAPGSRFDVAGEYLVMGTGEDDGDSSSEEGVGRGVVLETLPEEDGEEEQEVVEEESARKKLKCI